MIYVFHGDDDFTKSERLAELRAELGEYIDLNLTEIEGASTSLQELQHVCDVPPFLGDHRLVVLFGLLERLGQSKRGRDGGSTSGQDFASKLAEYIPTILPSTVLVFVEHVLISSKHPVLATIKKLGDQGEVVVFNAPSVKGGELVQWIEARAQQKGASLGRGVAFDLATFIGPDLRLLDSELEKLSIYVGDRPVTQDDIRLLTPYAKQANIFDMVDALSQRHTVNAFRLLAQLRNEGSHPLYLLTMIVRQYRILIQVQTLVSQGMDKELISRKLKLHPFPTQKAMQQVKRYSAQQLERIYDRLLATDVAIKTGQMDASLALDLLVIELART